MTEFVRLNYNFCMNCFYIYYEIALQKWMMVLFHWYFVICYRKISIIHLSLRCLLHSNLPINILQVGSRIIIRNVQLFIIYQVLNCAFSCVNIPEMVLYQNHIPENDSYVQFTMSILLIICIDICLL